MKKFQFEFLEIIIVLLAGLSGLIASYLNISIEIYLPIVFGFLIASSALLLKRELSTKIEEGHSIYRSLSKITDKELYKLGEKEIIRCLSKLEKLSNGEVELNGDEFYKYIIGKMGFTKNHVSAIHIAIAANGMNLWETDPGIKKYYLANKDAIRRGVKIDRLFILKKDVLIDSTTGNLDQQVLKIMENQHKDGINVELMLVESADKAINYDEFMIYDHSEVQVNRPRLNGKYSKIIIQKNDVIVKDFQNLFESLKASCQPLNDFLKSFGAKRIN